MQLYLSVSWGCGPLKARLGLKDQPLRWPQHRAGRAVLARGGRPLFLSRWFLRAAWFLRLLGSSGHGGQLPPEQEIQEGQSRSHKVMLPQCDVSLAHHHVYSILFTLASLMTQGHENWEGRSLGLPWSPETTSSPLKWWQPWRPGPEPASPTHKLWDLGNGLIFSVLLFLGSEMGAMRQSRSKQTK